MIRDFELVRKILLDVQAVPAEDGPISVEYPGEYEQATVVAHVGLMIDAGLLAGTMINGMGDDTEVSIDGLTWEGHDFIKVAAEDTLWKKAFSTVKEKGGVLTFEVLKGLLAKFALKAAGLP